VVANDHVVIRIGIFGLLRQTRDIRVVGEATNGQETIQVVQEMSPDILILDWVMPDMNGEEVINSLPDNFPRHRVLVVTATMNGEFVSLANSLGVGGIFHIPEDPPKSLPVAVRRLVRRWPLF
jgi:DNA-binding NarL/FixJ family response regulator